jgi:hypothetical protein
MKDHQGGTMDEKDCQFLKQFNDGKKTFIMVSNQAKKDIVVQDEDDFVEAMTEYINKSQGLSLEDAETYSKMIYGVWEDCGCSMTSFDRKLKDLREDLFP